jgi:hypothetical protein
MDAIMALEKAQEEFDQTKYRHRAILVLDNDRRPWSGKSASMQRLRALEPQYLKMTS